MVATRRAAAVQSLEAAAAAASDSDSDAPEEVTLHTSKNVASEQGKQERGAVRSAQKATKDRRRRLSGKSAPAQSPLDARTGAGASHCRVLLLVTNLAREQALQQSANVLTKN